MIKISVSALAHREDATLAAWLAGIGFDMTIGDGAARGGAARILHASERPKATYRDVLVQLADGPPCFLPSCDGLPATLRYGLDDMAFGHALVAELVRPAHRPACGEPDSARFLELAARIAASDATVLLLGETGTGKEGASRFIHACSPRATRDFIAVNCAALPETMLEAMLFGHQKGSFTGAGGSSEGLFRAADGGTLLLDEIAELPLVLQAKLLRAIQEREVLPVGATRAVPVDVRIIAAANRDLAAEVAAGRFRADLYWRLNVLPLHLKPLGERRLDIRAIAAALMVRHADPRQPFPWPTAAALQRLMAHRWPGNVRELENLIQRALLLRGGERIEVEDLGLTPVNEPILFPMRHVGSLAQPELVGGCFGTIGEGLRQVQPERASKTSLHEVSRASQARVIVDALAATGGHRLRTAELLGISERTLRYRLADLRANELAVAA